MQVASVEWALAVGRARSRVHTASELCTFPPKLGFECGVHGMHDRLVGTVQAGFYDVVSTDRTSIKWNYGLHLNTLQSCWTAVRVPDGFPQELRC